MPTTNQPANEQNPGFLEKSSVSNIIFAFVALIYVISLIPRTFWGENEAYYALGAGNVLDGHILLPIIYDNMFADKPPLMFWWVALVSWPFGGVTEYTARIANLIPAVSILFLVYRFALTLGPKIAVLSLVIIATAHEFYEVAFEVNTDILLTALLLTSWIAMYRIFTLGFTWKQWLLLWVPMALAMLTKGPVAPGLSCLVALAFALPHYGLRGGWRKLLTLRPFIGGALCFIPFLIWCGAVYSRYGFEPLNTVLFHHNLQRFVKAFDHQKPWYYYLYTLPIVILPWTIFLPLLAWEWWQAKRSRFKIPEWRSFALTIVVVLFVFFSMASSKRGYYLLPLLPWLAILLADAISRLGTDLLPAKRQKLNKLVRIIVFTTLALVLLHVSVGYQILDKHRSITALQQEVKRTTPHAAELILFEEEEPRIMFYLRENMTFYRDQPEANQSMSKLLSSGRTVDVICKKNQLARLQTLSPVGLYIEGSAVYRGKTFFVLTTDFTKGFPPLNSR